MPCRAANGQLSWFHYAPEPGQTQSCIATKMKRSEKPVDRPQRVASAWLLAKGRGTPAKKAGQMDKSWCQCHNRRRFTTEKSLESSSIC